MNFRSLEEAERYILTSFYARFGGGGMLARTVSQRWHGSRPFQDTRTKQRGALSRGEGAPLLLGEPRLPHHADMAA